MVMNSIIVSNVYKLCSLGFFFFKFLLTYITVNKAWAVETPYTHTNLVRRQDTPPSHKPTDLRESCLTFSSAEERHFSSSNAMFTLSWDIIDFNENVCL